jgi:hypothetical protein
LNWNDYFYYDETSPSGLRWKIEKFIGEFRSVKTVSKDQPAGSKQFNSDKTPKAYRVGLEGKDWSIHRIIWEMHNGAIPAENVIDHMDGNPFNNKIDNLYCKEQRYNCQNTRMKKSNSSGATGVFWGNKGYQGATFAIANWQCPEKGNRTKSFSALKYGLLPAFKMAFLHRKKMIEELNLKGEMYTERHGN